VLSIDRWACLIPPAFNPDITKSVLTSLYAKIVDAKNSDITTVDGICKLSPETLASNIGGSEDFAKRFKELKSQYTAALIAPAMPSRRLKTLH
jgi:hypothetical protein